ITEDAVALLDQRDRGKNERIMRASLHKAICLQVARFALPDVPVGWRTSQPSYWLFRDATTIKSILSFKASHGAAKDTARFVGKSCRECIEAWSARSAFPAAS